MVHTREMHPLCRCIQNRCIQNHPRKPEIPLPGQAGDRLSRSPPYRACSLHRHASTQVHDVLSVPSPRITLHCFVVTLVARVVGFAAEAQHIAAADRLFDFVLPNLLRTRTFNICMRKWVGEEKVQCSRTCASLRRFRASLQPRQRAAMCCVGQRNSGTAAQSLGKLIEEGGVLRERLRERRCGVADAKTL